MAEVAWTCGISAYRYLCWTQGWPQGTWGSTASSIKNRTMYVYIYIYICMYIIHWDVPQCRQQKFSVTFGFVSAAGQQTPHHWPHHRPFCRPESNDGKEALWNGLVAANCRDDRNWLFYSPLHLHTSPQIYRSTSPWNSPEPPEPSILKHLKHCRMAR